MGIYPKDEIDRLDARITNEAAAETWSVVAKGIVANGVNAGTIYTPVAGRQYVVFTAVPDSSIDNFSAGDEDLVTLVGFKMVSPTPSVRVNHTISGSITTDAEMGEFLATGSGANLAAAEAQAGGGPSGDTMRCFLEPNGTITADHQVDGTGTNGIYVVWEKS